MVHAGDGLQGTAATGVLWGLWEASQGAHSYLLQQVQVSFLVTTHSCPCFYCSVLCVDVEEDYGVSEAGVVFLVPGFLKGLIWISCICILDDTTSFIHFDQAGKYDDKVRFICISTG